jgi:alpha-ribazole phosphatase
MLTIWLLRHGKTAGNLLGRYNGRTDEPLCEEGVREAEEAERHPEISLVYSSPMLRARQTAKICFPNAEIITVPDLREMNFGDFEGRTAEEMEFDSDYRAWVAGGCVDRCPNGEGIPDFGQRAATAFAGAMQDAIARGETEIGVAAHGGVIMAVMTAFSGSDAPYHNWYVLNCGGYRITLDEAGWAATKRFSGYALFGQKGESSDMVGREMDA